MALASHWAAETSWLKTHRFCSYLYKIKYFIRTICNWYSHGLDRTACKLCLLLLTMMAQQWGMWSGMLYSFFTILFFFIFCLFVCLHVNRNVKIECAIAIREWKCMLPTVYWDDATRKGETNNIMEIVCLCLCNNLLDQIFMIRWKFLIFRLLDWVSVLLFVICVCEIKWTAHWSTWFYLVFWRHIKVIILN